MTAKTTLTMKPMVVLALWVLVIVLGYLGISAIDRHRTAANNEAIKNGPRVTYSPLQSVHVRCYEGLTIVNVGDHGFFYKLSPDGKPVPCKD